MTVMTFVIIDGVLSGADLGGVYYDGKISSSGEKFNCRLIYSIPKNGTLITGQSTSEIVNFETDVDLPSQFWNGQVLSIVTPTGPVNARFEILRSL